jgi:hypothetical protein
MYPRNIHLAGPSNDNDRNCTMLILEESINCMEINASNTVKIDHEQAVDKTAIRPFHVNVPEVELTELRRRINATRWPERETVTDASQGVW